jgi:hypothetical protein
LRPLVSGALGTAACLLLQGCASNPEPVSTASDSTQDPAGAVSAFLDAQRDGDFAKAIAMSTVTPDDFACAWQTADGQEPGGQVYRVEDADAASADAAATEPTDGDTVDVNATSGRDSSDQVTFTAVWQSDSWVVEWPTSYALEASFDAPAVADTHFDIDGEDSGCVVPFEDGKLSMLAFPNFYAAAFVDPTGVAEYGLGEPLIVSDDLGDGPLALGEPIDSQRLERLQGEMRGAIFAGNATCGGAQDALECVPVFAEAGDVRATANALTLTDVWTEDDRTWLFEAQAEDSTLTGTLSRDGDADPFDDALIVSFDS